MGIRIKTPSIYNFILYWKRGRSREVYILPELVKALKGFIKEKRNWDQRTGPEAPLLSGKGESILLQRP